MSEIKLKPCPFCGGEAKLICCEDEQDSFIDCAEELDAGCTYVHCYGCSTDFFPNSDIARDVLEAWNRRDGAE